MHQRAPTAWALGAGQDGRMQHPDHTGMYFPLLAHSPADPLFPTLSQNILPSLNAMKHIVMINTQ